MTPETQSLVLDRLNDTGNADEPWALILLAAMEGEADLDAFLDRTRSIDPPKRASKPKGPAPNLPAPTSAPSALRASAASVPPPRSPSAPAPALRSSPGATAPASRASPRGSNAS